MKTAIKRIFFFTSSGLLALLALGVLSIFFLIDSSRTREVISATPSPSHDYSALIVLDRWPTVPDVFRVRVIHTSTGEVLDDVGTFIRPLDASGKQGLALSWSNDDTLDISYAAIDRHNIDKTVLRHGGKTITVTINSGR